MVGRARLVMQSFVERIDQLNGAKESQVRFLLTHYAAACERRLGDRTSG